MKNYLTIAITAILITLTSCSKQSTPAPDQSGSNSTGNPASKGHGTTDTVGHVGGYWTGGHTIHTK